MVPTFSTPGPAPSEACQELCHWSQQAESSSSTQPLQKKQQQNFSLTPIKARRLQSLPYKWSEKEVIWVFIWEALYPLCYWGHSALRRQGVFQRIFTSWGGENKQEYLKQLKAFMINLKRAINDLAHLFWASWSKLKKEALWDTRTCSLQVGELFKGKAKKLQVLNN